MGRSTGQPPNQQNGMPLFGSTQKPAKNDNLSDLRFLKRKWQTEYNEWIKNPQEETKPGRHPEANHHWNNLDWKEYIRLYPGMNKVD